MPLRLVVPDPIPQFRDSTGAVVASGNLYSYEAGTTTAKALYADAQAASALPNPVVLDSAGRPLNSSSAVTPMFGDGAYKLVLQNSAGSTIWTADWLNFPDITTQAEALLDDTSFAAMRTTLGLGSVSTLTVGTAASNAVQLDANARLPAVDARNLTHVLPRSYLAGLTLSNDAGDTAQDINITAGECKDSTNVYDLILSSEITKQTDATWAVGNDAGGMGSGVSLSANTWYYVFLIARSDTGVVDAMFSDSLASPTLPTNYDYFRRIGAIKTAAAATTVLQFAQVGDEFLWDDPVLDVDTVTVATSSTTDTLPSVPSGLAVEAICNVGFKPNTGTGEHLYLRALSQDDEAVDAQTTPSAPLATISATSADPNHQQVRIRVDTSQQFAFRGDTASGTIEVATLGYIDRRGRDD